MKFNQTLNELTAEIMPGGKIPLRKIFINNNVPKAIPPQWRAVLEAIINKLRKLNLIDSFSKAIDPEDITGLAPKGNISLRADDGATYTYNVESDALYNSNKKKLG